MSDVNRKWNYKYDYPENRMIGKQIKKDDRIIIARASGYTYLTVKEILYGRRKMPEVVLKYTEMIIRINKKKEEILSGDIDKAIIETDVINLRQSLNKVHNKLAAAGTI